MSMLYLASSLATRAVPLWPYVVGIVAQGSYIPRRDSDRRNVFLFLLFLTAIKSDPPNAVI